MTRDDIIRLAQQAGLHHFYDSDGHCSGVTNAKIEGDENDVKLVEMLAPFAALVAAAEREACLALVNQGTGEATSADALKILRMERDRISAAIRARNEQEQPR
jgi:hypothetical protein